MSLNHSCFKKESAVADKPTRCAASWQTFLQTSNMDTQCDKLATKLSWQCFTSKVANLQLLHLH